MENSRRNSNVRVWISAISLIVVLTGFLIGGVKWGTSLDSRVEHTQEWIDRNRETIEKSMPKMETQLENIIKTLERVEKRIDQLGQRQGPYYRGGN